MNGHKRVTRHLGNATDRYNRTPDTVAHIHDMVTSPIYRTRSFMERAPPRGESITLIRSHQMKGYCRLEGTVDWSYSIPSKKGGCCHYRNDELRIVSTCIYL